MIDSIAPLFAPLQVKDKILRNRIVMPPIVVNRGLATPEACEWYGRRAAGGVSLVIVEATNSIGCNRSHLPALTCTLTYRGK